MTQIFSLFLLWCFIGVKFVIGPASVLAFGLSKFETFLFVFSSASFWSIFYYYLGAKIQVWLNKIFPKKKQRKLFSKSSRRLVKFKSSFGAWGLAFLIPIISIPISAILASKYFKHDKQIWLKYVVSSGVWTVILTYFSHGIISLIKSI